jgi:hypothetical protein
MMSFRDVRRSRLLGLAISLALLGVLALALPAGASAGMRLLYASGHDLDLDKLGTFGGNTAVDPGFGRLPEEGFDGCEDAQWAASLARTDFDVLTVGEDAADNCFGPDPTDLSPDTLTAIGNYVRNGKPIIFTGAHASEADFMNNIFGFNTTNVSDTSGETLTGTLQPGAAAGTPFAGGPATLTDLSATELLSGTPGIPIYTGPEGTWVFMAPFGLGSVTYLAWDFAGGTEEFEDDWYRVLDRALQVRNKFTIDSVTRNKKKGTATITVTVSFPGELTGTGKKAQVTSTGGATISKAVGVGQAQLLVKAKGKKKKKLNQKGKVKLNLAITETPTGGSPITQSVKVKLKKKLKKK